MLPDIEHPVCNNTRLYIYVYKNTIDNIVFNNL